MVTDALSGPPAGVVVVGGGGEFGRFLRTRILPGLGVQQTSSIERDTPEGERLERLAAARHVVLSTPLAGYADAARRLVRDVRSAQTPKTLWMIPSVQEPVLEAVRVELRAVRNPAIGVVLVHPMYGPMGFSAVEREARTFRNLVTSVEADAGHPAAREVHAIARRFARRFGIRTTTRFDVTQHDRITAASQGLSYLVALSMFDDPALDAEIAARFPDLHRSFHADHALIEEFLRLNRHVADVEATFRAAREDASGTGSDVVLRAFARVDDELNDRTVSPIPTKWYLRLREAAAGLAAR
jgi:prephenate dehydrogenase